jgi:hypothetical protein
MAFLVKKNNQKMFLMSVRMVSGYLMRRHHSLKFLEDNVIKKVDVVECQKVIDPDNPTLKEAIRGDEWDSLWRAACDEEFKTLFDFQVCEKVDFEDIPVGSKIFIRRWL